MSRWATLDSLKKEEEKKDERSNSYYAGGARGAGQGGSGLNVMGPPPDDDERSGAGGDPHVQEIFRRAEAGGPPPAGGSSARTVTMYMGGFTIDDGPFRRLDDPANKEFLKDLAQGVVPKELESSATPGRGTDINLVNKQNEEYVAPSYVAYGGQGQTMGSSSVAQEAVITSGSGDEGASAADVPEVDASQPSTTLQIRLHDGRRVRAQLNMHHTVAHVQAIIAREGAGNAPYLLMAGYPPAPLTAATQTLEEAGLKGAAITQKLA